MLQPIRFRRFRKSNHRSWMAGLLTGLLLGLLPACRWTPADGVANGTQSLWADDVLAQHHNGLEKNGYKIPEILAVKGQYRNLDWIFTRAEAYPLGGVNRGNLQLTTLTSEDLLRTQDPYFCAMRWDYGTRPESGMRFFANRKLLLMNPSRTIRAIVVRIVDWGPPINNEGGILLSQAALSALGISAGTTIGIAFESDNSSQTGPLVLGRQ